MKKHCEECNGLGYTNYYIVNDSIPIQLPCDYCEGKGYNEIDSVDLMVTIYTKPLVRKLLSIEETINRLNTPEIYEIVEAWIKYNYGKDYEYNYCEVDADEFEIIDENWSIENYR